MRVPGKAVYVSSRGKESSVCEFLAKQWNVLATRIGNSIGNILFWNTQFRRLINGTSHRVVNK
jgi:hypothetical protein